MAESQKKASVSVSLTEKDSLLDLDIGNDFLSNWKSTSLAEGDALEFDLTPVSKGNKKSFNFGKEDMDFNLDGDFGKMSSFKMDMSLDISPPVKKDGKSKENMDMSDLDISSPLKKEGKSKENSKKSPSKKDKGKADCFAFGFDFDELDNFGFESSLTKEGSSGSGCRDKDDSKNMNLLGNMSTLGGGTEKSSSPGTATPFSTDFLDGGTADLETSKKTFSVKEASKDEKDEDSKENFPSGSARQDKEGSEYMNLDESVTRNVCLLEDVSKKPSLPGTTMPFDMDLLGGGIADLEPTRKTYPSNIMDDTCNSTLSASTDEVSSGKATILPETTDSKQPPRNSQHEKWISKKPVDLEAGTGNDAIEELSSDFVLKNDLSIGDPSEELDKDDSRDIIATRSNEEEEDVNGHFISGTTCNYKAAVSEHSEQLQTAAISEKGGKSKDGSEDNVMDNKEKSNPGPTDSIVANSCITRPVPRTLSDTSNLKNQGPVPEILKSPIVSRSADNLLSEKKTVNGRETLLASSRTSIQSDKPECPEQVLSTRATVLTLSSKRTGFNQPGLAEGGREWTSIQSDRKLASFPLQHSKMLTTKELPQMQGQERCREVHKADKLQNQKKLNDISANNKDMVNRTAARQRETHMKVVETLSSSMEINRKPEKSTGNPTAVASLPSLKSTHSKEDNVCSLGGGKKTPDIPGLKLSSLNLDSTNPPVPKAIRSVGSIIQHQVLLKNTASSAVQSADTRRQISTLSMKRKALDESTAETFVLHPSKRPLQSPTPSRNVVQASAKVPEVKAPEHNNLGDAHIKSTLGNCQVSTYDVANEVKMKEVETSFSTENDSNIKLAGAYTKELDDLCNMMRKKQEEAKELLVQAIVNSNKLLMLNNPLLDEKIRATQNIFARLTLNSIHG